MGVPLWLIELLYSQTRNPGPKFEVFKKLHDDIFPPGFKYPGPKDGSFSEHPHGGRGRSGYKSGAVPNDTERGDGGISTASSGSGDDYSRRVDNHGGAYQANEGDAAVDELVARIIRAGKY